MISEARKGANEKWKAANKDKQKVYRYRSQAKKFIKDFADKKDLQELRILIDEREQQIK